MGFEVEISPTVIPETTRRRVSIVIMGTSMLDHWVACLPTRQAPPRPTLDRLNLESHKHFSSS